MHHTSSSRFRISITTSNTRQLLMAQLKRLLGLIAEPICHAHIKTNLLSHRHSGIKVGSTLEFLLKPCIIIELGKQG